MVQQSPALIIVLLSLPDIVAPPNHPDHPPCAWNFIFKEVLYASRIFAIIPGRRVLGKSPFRHDHGEAIRSVAFDGRVSHLKQISVVERATVNAEDNIIAVQLQDEFVFVAGEVSPPERGITRQESGSINDRLQVCVSIQAREENENIRVGRVDGG